MVEEVQKSLVADSVVFSHKLFIIISGSYQVEITSTRTRSTPLTLIALTPLDRIMASTSSKIKDEPPRQPDRIQILEDETKLLKSDVTKFLSIITMQTEQLARQEKIISELRDERNAKANDRLNMCWFILVVVVMLLLGVCYMGVPSMISEDTVLHLTTIVTPVRAPFITTGVKVRFTMGDLMACVKGAFSGDTIDLSLS